MWSFPYYGVPVYGTGWYYPPYWGGYYYPRPPTWGFHVGYNPWTGWNFGVSWSYGFFNMGVSWGGGYGYGCCAGGWYGGGYRRPVVINAGDINIGNNINIGNRAEISNRLGDNKLIAGDRNRNVYKNAENRDRLANSSQREALRKARPANQRVNNVFADRDGNIARNVDGAWEKRSNGQWSRDAIPSFSELNRQGIGSAADRRPSTSDFRDRASSGGIKRGGFDRSGFDRANRARNMGARREMSRPGGFQRRR